MAEPRCVLYSESMTFVEAAILGLIEGLTEFFPISSTGHLIIAEKMLGIHEPSLFFNVMIQLGAISALVWYMRVKVKSVIEEVLHGKFHTAMYIGIATLPALAAGYFFHDAVKYMQSSVFVVGLATIVVALIMLVVEQARLKTSHTGKLSKEKNWKDYVVIGLWQAVSIIPGVSRSGSTMLGGLVRQFSFHDAVETSFLVGIPTMAAAGLYECYSLWKTGFTLDGNLIQTTVIGFVISFFVAYGTIAITLPILKKYGFMPFVVYRIVLGIGLFLFFV